MKRFWYVSSGAVLFAATVAVAQAGQGPAQAPVSLSAGLQQAWNTVSSYLTQALDAMPEENFNFKTTEANKTFGAQFGHVANFRYFLCSAARGVPNPNQGNNLEQVSTKGEMVKALAESTAFCAEAFKSLTDQSALEMVSQGRGGQIARGALLSNLIAHDNEEYGVITQYLRMKGVVPPSSASRGGGRGGRGRGN